MKNILFSVALAGCLSVAASIKVPAQINLGGVLLNEIVMAPPGNDSGSGCEYVEFHGLPNTIIGNFTYIDIEGDAEQNPGTVNYIRSLQGLSTGDNGLLIIASSTSCRSFEASSAIFLDPTFQSSYSVRNNGTNSFLIYAGQLSYLRGQDLDVNNDGTEDSEAELFDGIAVLDGDHNPGDIQYGYAKLGRRSGTPSGEAINAATRFAKNFKRNSVASFYFGDLVSSPDTVEYSSSINSRSLNFPATGRLTPGTTNVPYSREKTIAINGQVITKAGRGVDKAVITAVNSNGDIQITQTNPFGYFRFNEIVIGDMYLFKANHKRHDTATQIVIVKKGMGNLQLIANR